MRRRHCRQLPGGLGRPAAGHPLLTIDTVGTPDDWLPKLATTLIDNPAEGEQLIARDNDGAPVGFATVYWTWQTLTAARVGVLNDLYVVPGLRGSGTGRALIERARQRCREHQASKLGGPHNTTAQRLYDGIGAQQSTCLTYEIDA